MKKDIPFKVPPKGNNKDLETFPQKSGSYDLNVPDELIIKIAIESLKGKKIFEKETERAKIFFSKAIYDI